MRIRSIPLVAFAAVGAALAVPATAFATSTPVAASCATVKHTDLTGVSWGADGKATLTGKGVDLSTPGRDDQVQWHTAVTPVKLTDVKAMSYEYYKYDTGADSALVAPAYDVTLNLGGGKTAELVYEPYWQSKEAGLLKPPTGTWVTESPMLGRWWTWSNDVAGMVAEPGGGEHNAPWAAIVAANPTATVTGFGWHQGTYNAGAHTKVNSVKFGSGGTCAKHNWAISAPSPVPTATATPSDTPSAPPSDTPSDTPSASSSAPAGVGGGSTPSATPTRDTAQTLPVTGAGAGTAAGVALLFIAVGGAAVYLMRRRRTRFQV